MCAFVPPLSGLARKPLTSSLPSATLTSSMRSSTFIPRHTSLNKPVSSLSQCNNNYHKKTTIKNSITVERLANKSYQLEEDEDENSCTTAIYLHEDGSVTLGQTDGPDPDSVKASWSYRDEDGELSIDIERYFQGEQNIEFMVKRILVGHLDNSSRKNLDLPIFTGAMYPYPTDFAKHTAVGFFAMILATDDLPKEDYDISQEK